MIFLYDRNLLGQYLNNLKLNGFGIEIGVQRGHYSMQVLSKWNGKKWYMLDAWEHQDETVYIDKANVNDDEQLKIMKEAEKNVSKFKNRYELIKGYSNNTNILNKFSDNFFDCIYIDADHSYEGAKRDIELWYPKLKTGGVFCGHDYMDGNFKGEFGIVGLFGVKTAVDEFSKKINKKIYSTNEPICKTWYFIK